MIFVLLADQIVIADVDAIRVEIDPAADRLLRDEQRARIAQRGQRRAELFVRQDAAGTPHSVS
jgi:hypothetical protein